MTIKKQYSGYFMIVLTCFLIIGCWGREIDNRKIMSPVKKSNSTTSTNNRNQHLFGEIVLLKGEVLYKPITPGKKWQKCTTATKLYPQSLIKTLSHSKCRLKLGDKNLISLGNNSILHLSHYNRNSQEIDQIKCFLKKGRAFFQIMGLKNRTRFQVKTLGSRLETKNNSSFYIDIGYSNVKIAVKKGNSTIKRHFSLVRVRAINDSIRRIEKLTNNRNTLKSGETVDVDFQSQRYVRLAYQKAIESEAIDFGKLQKQVLLKKYLSFPQTKENMRKLNENFNLQVKNTRDDIRYIGHRPYDNKRSSNYYHIQKNQSTDIDILDNN